MPRIAISYRRSDSGAITGRIFDRVAAHFGPDSVFMDIDAIPLGVDFRKYIDGALKTTDFLLVVIGSNWLGIRADGNARIREPTDPVRIELEAALRNGLTVIPILVDGVPMPATSDLPDSLHDFVFINAAEISIGKDFQSHVDRLIRFLDDSVKERNAYWAQQDSGPKKEEATETPRVPLDSVGPIVRRKLSRNAWIAGSLLIGVLCVGGFAHWKWPNLFGEKSVPTPSAVAVQATVSTLPVASKAPEVHATLQAAARPIVAAGTPKPVSTPKKTVSQTTKLTMTPLPKSAPENQIVRPKGFVKVEVPSDYSQFNLSYKGLYIRIHGCIPNIAEFINTYSTPISFDLSADGVDIDTNKPVFAKPLQLGRLHIRSGGYAEAYWTCPSFREEWNVMVRNVRYTADDSGPIADQ